MEDKNNVVVNVWLLTPSGALNPVNYIIVLYVTLPIIKFRRLFYMDGKLV